MLSTQPILCVHAGETWGYLGEFKTYLPCGREKSLVKWNWMLKTIEIVALQPLLILLLNAFYHWPLSLLLFLCGDLSYDWFQPTHGVITADEELFFFLVRTLLQCVYAASPLFEWIKVAFVPPRCHNVDFLSAFSTFRLLCVISGMLLRATSESRNKHPTFNLYSVGGLLLWYESYPFSWDEIL